jgi:hypothetical protein
MTPSSAAWRFFQAPTHGREYRLWTPEGDAVVSFRQVSKSFDPTIFLLDDQCYRNQELGGEEFQFQTAIGRKRFRAWLNDVNVLIFDRRWDDMADYKQMPKYNFGRPIDPSILRSSFRRSLWCGNCLIVRMAGADMDGRQLLSCRHKLTIGSFQPKWLVPAPKGPAKQGWASWSSTRIFLPGRNPRRMNFKTLSLPDRHECRRIAK